MQRVFETDDLALSAFLLMRSVKLSRYAKAKSKVTWYFADADGPKGMTQCQLIHTEFLNSECKRYDSFVRDLKKMLRKE